MKSDVTNIFLRGLRCYVLDSKVHASQEHCETAATACNTSLKNISIHRQILSAVRLIIVDLMWAFYVKACGLSCLGSFGLRDHTQMAPPSAQCGPQPS
jgi:hypothetical protein